MTREHTETQSTKYITATTMAGNMCMCIFSFIFNFPSVRSMGCCFGFPCHQRYFFSSSSSTMWKSTRLPSNRSIVYIWIVPIYHIRMAHKQYERCTVGFCSFKILCAHVVFDTCSHLALPWPLLFVRCSIASHCFVDGKINGDRFGLLLLSSSSSNARKIKLLLQSNNEFIRLIYRIHCIASFSIIIDFQFQRKVVSALESLGIFSADNSNKNYYD